MWHVMMRRQSIADAKLHRDCQHCERWAGVVRIKHRHLDLAPLLLTCLNVVRPCIYPE